MDTKDLLKDKEIVRWLINQGSNFVILLVLGGSMLYLLFTYTPVFVNHVGSLAESTKQIDHHLADMVEDTRYIRKTDDEILETIKENNTILKTKCK